MPTRRQLLRALPTVALATCGLSPGQRDAAARARLAVGEMMREPPAPVRSAAEPEPRLVDEAPQRLLVIGDSMIYSLLAVLADYCLENRHCLHPAIWLGSTSSGWATSRKLDELLIRHRPTFVVVVLGSSEVWGTGLSRLVPRAAHRLSARVGARKLVWVGPLSWHPGKVPAGPRLDLANQGAAAITTALQHALGKGRVLCSTDLAVERMADGIHPTAEGGRRWAEQLIRWLRDESDFPIVLRPPTRQAPLPSATFYGAAWKQGQG